MIKKNLAFFVLLQLSLHDCLLMAKQYNDLLKAKGVAIEGAKWRQSEAQAAFQPVLEYKDRMAPVPTDADNPIKSLGKGELTFFNSIHLGLGIPVFTFGKLSTAQALAGKGIEESQGRLVMEEGKLAFEVKQLYYGILLGDEIERLLKDALEKIDAQLAKEEETKEHSPYDIAKLKVFRIEAEKKHREALQKQELAYAALRVQLGLPEGAVVALKDQELEPLATTATPLSQYQKKATAERPDFQLLEVGVAAKKLEHRLEKEKWLPDIGVGGFVDLGKTSSDVRGLVATDDFTDPFNFARAGVGLEISGKFDWHGSRARINRLASEVKKAELESGMAKKGLELEIETAYQEMEGLKGDLDLAEQRKKLAQQMVFLSKSNQEVGVGEEKEYTDALQLLLLSRADYFKSVFDYNVAVAKLEWKTGTKIP